MAVLDGPRTPLPFAQIGNWEFLIEGFPLYRKSRRSSTLPTLCTGGCSCRSALGVAMASNMYGALADEARHIARHHPRAIWDMPGQKEAITWL